MIFFHKESKSPSLKKFSLVGGGEGGCGVGVGGERGLGVGLGGTWMDSRTGPN